MEVAGQWFTIYPLDSYMFEHSRGNDPGDEKRAARCADADDSHPEVTERRFREQGMLRSVGGILLVHHHGFPHVLLMRREDGTWKIPGGRLDGGAGEVGGLKNMLGLQLGRRARSWEVGGLVATWWRPNYDYHMYPYKPAHVSLPKERRKLFLVELPREGAFSVVQGFKLVAVPLCDLYGKHREYGPIIASIPYVISRFSLNLDVPTLEDDTTMAEDGTAGAGAGAGSAAPAGAGAGATSGAAVGDAAGGNGTGDGGAGTAALDAAAHSTGDGKQAPPAPPAPPA